jgi:hypothetical protein
VIGEALKTEGPGTNGRWLNKTASADELLLRLVTPFI